MSILNEYPIYSKYYIRPYYCTMCLGFFKITGKLVVQYVSTYTKGTLKQGSVNDAYVMLLCFLFFLIFFIKAHIVGTHLNCIDKLMHFKWAPTTYAFIKK